ncbi:MAG: hypothetical protein ABL894_13800 [Hyphomicrobium sp.]
MLFIPNLSRGTHCFAAHDGHRSLDNDHGLVRVFLDKVTLSRKPVLTGWLALLSVVAL